MKVAYFGCDLYMDCTRILELHGYDICFVFIKPATQYNDKLIKFAESRKLPLIIENPTILHLQTLVSNGVNCIFSCSYGWKIPIHQDIRYSFNVHPTLLPYGRGPNPLFWILKNYPQHFGITFHKLTNVFDQGDIIYQEKVTVEINDSLETLMMKLEILIPAALDRCLSDFENLYQYSKVQTTGTNWPKVTVKDMSINWEEPIERIELLVRSLGRFGAIAKLGEKYYLISNIEVVACNSNYSSGQIIKEDSEMIAVAVQGAIAIISKRAIISGVDPDALGELAKQN